MIRFFKDKKNLNNMNNQLLSKIASLLIHAAKIDEIYTESEKEIIKKTLIQLGAEKSNLEKLMSDAEINEDKSNQIFDFTKEIKNMSEADKVKIIETLWKIVYSDKNADMYESNLMRRLSGLLYIDDNVMGKIKQKIKKETAE
tara:strand:- start:110 stop:538 length:429 start_codon:yes stop_codon:yes gene_type:complete